MSLQRRFESYLGWCVRKSVNRERPFIIGVAGSVGKSSTKTAIGVALGAGEKGTGVVASEKNFNNELGVPLVIFGAEMPQRSVLKWTSLLLKAGLTAIGVFRLRAKTYVLELGTDRPGDLTHLIGLVRPHIGVLTAIGPEHTEFFGSVQGVHDEEATIIRSLGAKDIAVVNADDTLVHESARNILARVVSFGTSADASFRILSTSIQIDEASPEDSGLDIELSLGGTTKNIRLKHTVGRPQAYAVAAALACAEACGVDSTVALARLSRSFDGMPGRMRLLSGIKRTWLIDDTYNSSPLAARSALRDVASFPLPASGQRIAALGDMLELGELAESAHADMGRAAAEAGIDMLVACGTLAHVVGRAAIEAGMSQDHVFTFAQSSEAGRFIQERMHEGDVVLIKGSQGVRMERITRELMAHPEQAEKLLVRQTKDWLEKE